MKYLARTLTKLTVLRSLDVWMEEASAGATALLSTLVATQRATRLALTHHFASTMYFPPLCALLLCLCSLRGLELQARSVEVADAAAPEPPPLTRLSLGIPDLDLQVAPLLPHAVATGTGSAPLLSLTSTPPRAQTRRCGHSHVLRVRTRMTHP